MKKMNKKGFTLAELLIVVAIIAVLVAIAIPVFNAQLEKSREATDIANVRSAYAEVVAEYLANASGKTANVTVTQKQPNWQGQSGRLAIQVDGTESFINIPAKTSGQYTVTITDSGSVSVG
jgi:type IV pilus assembly protein PilA